MTVPRHHRLPLLDGLRGVAALLVMLHHEPRLYGSAGLFPRAYLAVDFFFMLSGLVLTPATEPRLRAGLSPERFLLQRIARLWPVLALGMLIGGWRALLHDGAGAMLPLLCSLLLIPLLTGVGAIYRLDGPQWSISFELIANYAHARLLWRLNNRLLLTFVLVMGAVLAGLIAHFDTLGFGDITTNWWGGFARVGFAYALGVWMARMMQAGHGARLSASWWLAALPLIFVLTLVPLLPLGQAAGDALAVFVLLPPALWLAAHARVPAGVARLCTGLGALSYPLYALHVPLLVMGGHIAMGAPMAERLPIRLATMATVLILSALVAASPLARGWRLNEKGRQVAPPPSVVG